MSVHLCIIMSEIMAGRDPAELAQEVGLDSVIEAIETLEGRV